MGGQGVGLCAAQKRIGALIERIADAARPVAQGVGYRGGVELVQNQLDIGLAGQQRLIHFQQQHQPGGQGAVDFGTNVAQHDVARVLQGVVDRGEL